MDIWGRWSQCKTCKKECGWSEFIGVEEDHPYIEHFYDCEDKETCDTDMYCNKYEES